MAVQTEVRFGDDSGLGDIILDSKDLSENGAFVSSEILFEIGEELKLEFVIPGTKRTIRARGRVVRVNRANDSGLGPGMGIEFLDLSEQDRRALAAFVSISEH